MQHVNQEYQCLEPRKVFENAIQTFRLYEDTIARKQFKIKCSDGSHLEFAFNDNNICHLMGIDFEKTKDLLYDHEYIYNYNITSYEVLVFLFNNIYVMLNIYNNLDSELFSLYKIKTKADSLKLFLDLENLDFFRVHRLSEMKDYNGNLKSNNFLVKENNEYLHLLGIVTNNDVTYIETIFCAFNNQKFLNKQKITFPVQIEVDGKYYEGIRKPINIVNRNKKYYKDFARQNNSYLDDSYTHFFIKSAKEKKKIKQKRLIIE